MRCGLVGGPVTQGWALGFLKPTQGSVFLSPAFASGSELSAPVPEPAWLHVPHHDCHGFTFWNCKQAPDYMLSVRSLPWSWRFTTAKEQWLNLCFSVLPSAPSAVCDFDSNRLSAEVVSYCNFILIFSMSNDSVSLYNPCGHSRCFLWRSIYLYPLENTSESP